MNFELKPEHERTIELGLASGAYQNREEVLDQAFETLREQLENEDWMRSQSDRIASQIATAFAQAESGQLIDGADAMSMLRQRRADQLNSQR